jgi:predicted nucleic acid-binding protein
LLKTVSHSSRWNVLGYTAAADERFRQLRRQRVRIGSHDLRIAALALVHGFTIEFVFRAIRTGRQLTPDE